MSVVTFGWMRWLCTCVNMRGRAPGLKFTHSTGVSLHVAPDRPWEEDGKADPEGFELRPEAL